MDDRANALKSSLQPKPVGDSASEMVGYGLPNDANALGTLLGGRLLHWIDLAGALAAHRHVHSPVVTASVDHMDFWLRRTSETSSCCSRR